MSLRRRKTHEIDPDEVLMDAHNISQFDRDQFEGRMERPISKPALYTVLGVFLLVASVYVFQTANLQIIHGSEYSARSQANLLRSVPIFAARGIIYDRNGIPLAWNAPATADADASTTNDVNNVIAQRNYATSTGLSHVLGYVQYPSKDSNGFYYQEDFNGVAGVEKYYDSLLQGVNGSRLIEVNARGKVVSENVVRPAQAGNGITLSIDSRVQSALFSSIKDVATRVNFKGGAGIIMDVHTGEVLAMTSYPEYSSEIMSDKTDSAAIRGFLTDKNQPFLDRITDGLYTPGSIVKPYVAMGVLTEKIIDPYKLIHDSGSISITNPYNPSQVSVFRDWKALGSLDLRHGIAMSSDVYFYTVGGGYKDQPGLGITRLDKYFSMFGFGTKIAPSFFTGPAGLIPTPAWKQKTFGEDWYLGDTYHTAIGQYGFQVTPAQVIRAVGSMANYGTLLTPSILKDSEPHVEGVVPLAKSDFDVVHEGMRLSATIGVAKALGVSYVNVAAKTGTAELGVSKANVNSWVTGFWPYENPKYAFAVVMDHGAVENLIGAAAVMRETLDWMHVNTPEYLK
ncbi:MAG: penicillin-binding transpeptidase domain-containing protein [Candidatus Pacebacteria bacterium]|nr:penicillin-binding transpeptidase domain-containing protein [Candidatus Paceibacterota bacterium]